MKKRLVIALGITLMSIPAFAQDLAGTWVGVVRAAAAGGQAPSANGGPLPFIVHINQMGGSVTGTMDGIGGAPDVEIQMATVNGNVLTYVAVRQINGQDVTFNYTATLDGDTLEFLIEREGGGNALASTTTRLTTAF